MLDSVSSTFHEDDEKPHARLHNSGTLFLLH